MADPCVVVVMDAKCSVVATLVGRYRTPNEPSAHTADAPATTNRAAVTLCVVLIAHVTWVMGVCTKPSPGWSRRSAEETGCRETGAGGRTSGRNVLLRVSRMRPRSQDMDGLMGQDYRARVEGGLWFHSVSQSAPLRPLRELLSMVASAGCRDTTARLTGQWQG